MFSRIRKRITYANVAMTLALVFVMTGGAYAASKYLITSTKQISPKVLKALKGASGKNGASGPVGASGPAGAAGPAGPQGPGGTAGANGENGTNGKEGEKGKEGSPWTAGGTLPSGKSEEGEWGEWNTNATAGEKSFAISFVIPLKTAPAAHYIGTKEELAGEKHESLAIKEGKCKGNHENPEAAPGNLCVFATGEVGVKVGGPPVIFLDVQGGNKTSEAAGTAGTLLIFESEAGFVLMAGTWVVTG